MEYDRVSQNLEIALATSWQYVGCNYSVVVECGTNVCTAKDSLAMTSESFLQASSHFFAEHSSVFSCSRDGPAFDSKCSATRACIVKNSSLKKSN